MEPLYNISNIEELDECICVMDDKQYDICDDKLYEYTDSRIKLFINSYLFCMYNNYSINIIKYVNDAYMVINYDEYIIAELSLTHHISVFDSITFTKNALLSVYNGNNINYLVQLVTIINYYNKYKNSDVTHKYNNKCECHWFGVFCYLTDFDNCKVMTEKELCKIIKNGTVKSFIKKYYL